MGELPGVPFKPMLSFSVDLPFDSPEHLFEAKWDGARCLAFFDNDNTHLFDRCSNDVTFRYPELLGAGALFDGKEVVVDGELIVLANGKPNSLLLQARESLSDPVIIKNAAETSPILYIVFDILSVDGHDIFHLPLLDRKDILKSSLRQNKHLVAGSYIEENGKSFFDQLMRAGIEGMMAKAKSSGYLPGVRSENWLKVKQFKTQDCLICGYTVGMGRRAEMLGALVLGVFNKGELIHVGQVGSGFSEESLRSVFEMLQGLRTESSPFSQEPLIDRPTTWVRPELICRVEYSEWTSDTKLRLARFLTLREDKPREECTIEELGQYKRMG